jgi:hypothetical protein
VIVFIIYAVLLTALIWRYGFFGLFRDALIPGRHWALLFAGKLLAVPVFLLIYTRVYGGIGDLDTGKFYQDALVIYEFGKQDPGFLLRIMTGLQDDREGSYDHIMALTNTMNWDNGEFKEFFYNDNRIVIRLHVLLNFLAFGSYMAHALFNCFISFIGIFFLFKTFREWFPEREYPLLLLLCFFPSLWFYTGALLKEGITLFVLGSTLYAIRLLINGRTGLLHLAGLGGLLFLSALLKPYLLGFSVICFSLFFITGRFAPHRWRLAVFSGGMLLAGLVGNLAAALIKKQPVTEAVLEHQHRFIGVSRGGIFLFDSTRFLRLSHDTGQIRPVDGKDKFYTLRPGVSYMYWEGEAKHDTLYCLHNCDTLSVYELAYSITPSQSNLDIPYSKPLQALGACFYYTLLYPTPFHARNALQLLASFENILIGLALGVILYGLIRRKRDSYLPLVFLFFSLSLCLLIAFTAPNSGAIFRYRSPVVIFLLMAALYYMERPFSGRKLPPAET